MAEFTAADAKTLRNVTGLGLMDCKKAFTLADTPEFSGDVVLAVAYLDANSCAVHVKGDRHSWALARAHARVADMRARNPDLDRAFPAWSIMSSHPNPRAMVDTSPLSNAPTAPEHALADLLTAVARLLETGSRDTGLSSDTRIALTEAEVAHRRFKQNQDNRTETDRLIESFSGILKAKLDTAESKRGWNNKWMQSDWEEECRIHLSRHVGKGDPRDVAIYAAFCWHHGWSTSPVVATVCEGGPWTLAKAFDLGFTWAQDLTQDHAHHSDSRDVGRTLTSSLFGNLALNYDAVPSFESADAGRVAAKREIMRALDAIPLDQVR